MGYYYVYWFYVISQKKLMRHLFIYLFTSIRANEQWILQKIKVCVHPQLIEQFMKDGNMHGFCEFGEGKGTPSTLESKRMSVPNIN